MGKVSSYIANTVCKVPKSCVGVLKLLSQLKKCVSWILLFLKEITFYKAIDCSGSNVLRHIHFFLCVYTHTQSEREIYKYN